VATTRTPRRLSRDARREQLVLAAMPVLAEQGFTEFSLEDVATPADVTRNLLYHYFPRGRADITLAVVERAGRELVGDWLTDDDVSLPERLTANFTRMMTHAMGPSDAWRIHRRARYAGEPELDEVQARNYESVISSISLNHLGTPDPSPLVHLALTGFLAFGETVLDEARVRNTPAAEVMRLLAETLVATVQSAGSPSGV
jgi:AcrR family transcriptional regulator